MLRNFFNWLLSLRLFSRQNQIDDPWKVIAWWEVRRIAYNLLVGSAGFLSCCIILFMSLLAEKFTGETVGMPDPPIFMIFFIIAYAILANICFTLGWMIELLVRHIWRERAEAIGEISFAIGSMFSVLLTLLPGLVITVIDLIVIATHA